MPLLSARETLFQRNRKAFVFRYPHQAQILPVAAPQSESPHPSVPLDISPSARCARVALVFGCGHLLHVYTTFVGLEETGILVIEPDLQRLHVFLASLDLREYLLSPAIHWIVGPDWRQDLAALIEQKALFTCTPADFYFHDNASEPIYRDLAAQCRQTLGQIIPVLNRQAHINWQAYASHQPSCKEAFRVWAHVEEKAPIYTGIVNGWLDAFRKAGHPVFLSTRTREWRNQEQVMNELLAFKPDALFFLNGPSQQTLQYLGFSPEQAATLPARRITWYVDHPGYLSAQPAGQQATGNDDIAAIDRTYRAEFGPDVHFLHLPHAAMLTQRGSFNPKFAYPIVYVGSLLDPRSVLHTLPAATVDIIKLLTALKKQTPERSLYSLLQETSPSPAAQHRLREAAHKFNAEKTKKHFSQPHLELDYFLYVAATFLTRWEMTQALLPLGLHVFGPNDWLDVLGSAYKDRYHGTLRHTKLADCYASARINLNFHSLQCPTCLNNRDFDVPFAGGFLLTDQVEDAQRGYVNDGEHLCVVDGVEALQERASYFLAHADERQTIAEQGHRHVAKYHTYTSRFETLRQFMQK
jgi:hypothetical protein